MALSRSAVGWSALCDCSISKPYSLTFSFHPKMDTDGSCKVHINCIETSKRRYDVKLCTS